MQNIYTICLFFCHLMHGRAIMFLQSCVHLSLLLMLHQPLHLHDSESREGCLSIKIHMHASFSNCTMCMFRIIFKPLLLLATSKASCTNMLPTRRRVNRVTHITQLEALIYIKPKALLCSSLCAARNFLIYEQ